MVQGGCRRSGVGAHGPGGLPALRGGHAWSRVALGAPGWGRLVQGGWRRSGVGMLGPGWLAAGRGGRAWSRVAGGGPGWARLVQGGWRQAAVPPPSTRPGCCAFLLFLPIMLINWRQAHQLWGLAGCQEGVPNHKCTGPLPLRQTSHPTLLSPPPYATRRHTGTRTLISWRRSRLPSRLGSTRAKSWSPAAPSARWQSSLTAGRRCGSRWAEYRASFRTMQSAISASESSLAAAAPCPQTYMSG